MDALMLNLGPETDCPLFRVIVLGAGRARDCLAPFQFLFCSLSDLAV